VHSDATTVEGYLASLPEDRRAAISAVRDVILANLAEGFEEAMNWGMICYQVPLSTYPKTYNGQPLMYAALASQKNHMAVYLTGIYMSDQAREDFERKYRATGKRMDAGKSCVRFRSLDDLPLDLIGECIAADSVLDFCARFEDVQAARRAQEMDVEQEEERTISPAPSGLATAEVTSAIAAAPVVERKLDPRPTPAPKPKRAPKPKPAPEPAPEPAAESAPKKKAAAKKKAAPKKKAAAKKKAAPKKKAAAKKRPAPKKKAAAKKQASARKKR
jgi:hypothetical protein